MNLTSAWARPLPRLLCIAGLLLFLTFVFSFQLFFAGYVTPWSRAFSQEAVYWLSCGILALPILWMCRRLHRGGYGWVRYAGALMLGAIIAVALQPIVANGIIVVLGVLNLCSSCAEGLPAQQLVTLAHTLGRYQPAGLRGFRAGLACGDLLPRVARPAIEGAGARIPAAPGAAAGSAQPAQSALPVQCAALDRRAGAREPEARRAADRAAGRAAAAGAAVVDASGSARSPKSSNSSADTSTSSRCASATGCA